MSKYESKFNYITRFQYNLDIQSRREVANSVVVSPKVARDIENMQSYISQLEKEVRELKSQASIYGMGLVK